MSRLQELFFTHPASVGESYTDHARFAGMTGLRLIMAGLACLVHGFLPFLFVRTASDCIRDLSADIARRGR